ncbi:MAG: hypothetical protein RLZZ175_2551 [Bacteroidota bacterium]|jgi:ATP-dependent DNA helicase RecQ
MQFKAGYIADSIAKVIIDYKAKLDKYNEKDNYKFLQIDGLLEYVSSFDVNFKDNLSVDFHKINPVLATINNIITRGLPTRLPVFIEELFSQIGITKPNEREFEFDFSKANKDIEFETIFELLHILEPKLEISQKQYGGLPGSFSEWKFLDETLKDYPFAKQILQSQRDFSTIDKKLAGGKTLDFSFEFPYKIISNSLNGKLRKGLIFEFDGPHHKRQDFKYYDRYRDNVADEKDFETLRQSYEELGLNPLMNDFLKEDIFKIFNINYNRETIAFENEFSLIFIPLAVARIQKTLIELLIRKPDLIKKECLKIAIVERDFPCGAIALKSLKDFINNINSLLEKDDNLILPKFDLTIFDNKNWLKDERLHLDANRQNEEYFKLNTFDIVIDHAILRRSNIYKENDFICENAIKIRSSHYFDTSYGRKIYCSDILNYKQLVEKQDDGSYKSIKENEKHINFFIQNIFRKKEFREGQLPIISRALQQKPVIGLLPTGGGKSLTFQLPTFLQPGLCLVVDPIKSLMEDQVRVLKENWIDCCEYINSNDKRQDKTKKLIDFRFGETMFLFVSPERFVMEDFRSIIKNINSNKFGLAFSYCVIDEVHCVSEWGHDFRTTYLMLGKNAQKFATTKSKKPVTLIGLTATASFDVLTDIERELKIEHNDIANAIILIENTIRPELFFRVIDVSGKNRMEELNKDFQNIGKNLSIINNSDLLLRSQKHHFEEFDKKDFATKETKDLNDNAKITFEYNSRYLIEKPLETYSQNDFFSIVFCPVIGEKLDNNGDWSNKNGVRYVESKLDSNSKGFFFASDDDQIGEDVHKHFENFTTNKTKHIVCTKAFGMGIDKKDIRSTYHYFYSGSLESLVQEAGRSGRDKKISIANILISKSRFVKLDVYKFFRENMNLKLLTENKETRKSIRQEFEKVWIESTPIDVNFSTYEEAINKIDNTDFSLQRRDNTRYNILSDSSILDLKSKLKEKDNDNNYKFIIQKYHDRNIHDYFHELTFKGVDIEKSQLLNLFKVKEFQIIGGGFIEIQNQDTLINEFDKCETEQFNFIITAEKKYTDASLVICQLLNVNPAQNPNFGNDTNLERVHKAYLYSNDFQDFLFQLEEKDVKRLSGISGKVKDDLLFVYNRDRETSSDTGRLIYRMHSIGLLIDYEIDYNKNNLYKCTFRKYNSIEPYIDEIEIYLRRYLSENSALESIWKLKERLTKHEILTDKILECLYFLSEFSYKEVADKRKRATDEIESILIKSVTETNYIEDSFQQNLFIKEQIFFYFNAKYARSGFKIEGKPYSLLDDYKGTLLTKEEILYKYLGTEENLGVFKLEGTEQNNYKHMMGSCKKILRSLSETDLKKEWLLRLLKAFSMYSVNNESYISEANEDLEIGFINIYNDSEFHKNKFETIEPIFNYYFDILEKNIQKENKSFLDIKLIRNKILIEMQTMSIDKLITNNKFRTEIYA